jgi:putative tricarboxylic transport membrane protein
MTDDDREDRSTAVRTRRPRARGGRLPVCHRPLVITDSLRVGIGWADDGPRAGYFPFYIGCCWLLVLGWTLLAHPARRWSRETALFARPRASCATVLARCCWPTTVFIVAVP